METSSEPYVAVAIRQPPFPWVPLSEPSALPIGILNDTNSDGIGWNNIPSISIKTKYVPGSMVVPLELLLNLLMYELD